MLTWQPVDLLRVNSQITKKMVEVIFGRRRLELITGNQCLTVKRLVIFISRCNHFQPILLDKKKLDILKIVGILALT